MKLELKAGNVALSTWAEIYRGASAALDPSCRDRIAASAASVARIVVRGEPVYGINTGFGKLASVRIEADDLGDASAQHRAVAFGRRGRSDAGSPSCA